MASAIDSGGIGGSAGETTRIVGTSRLSESVFLNRFSANGLRLSPDFLNRMTAIAQTSAQDSENSSPGPTCMAGGMA